MDKLERMGKGEILQVLVLMIRIKGLSAWGFGLMSSPLPPR